MFGYAKEHEPCIIFMDEIDAIGGRRFSEGTSADREIQRTLMEARPDPPFISARIVRVLMKSSPKRTASESDGWVRLLGQDKDHHVRRSVKVNQMKLRPDHFAPILHRATNRPDTLVRRLEPPSCH